MSGFPPISTTPIRPGVGPDGQWSVVLSHLSVNPFRLSFPQLVELVVMIARGMDRQDQTRFLALITEFTTKDQT